MWRKINIVFTCFLFTCSFTLNAQENIEALKKKLENQKNDTTQVGTLIELYEVLKYDDPDLASEYLTKSLQ